MEVTSEGPVSGLTSGMSKDVITKHIIMKTIIAPTDFSPCSINAVNYAADLATVAGASLSLIHVCNWPLVISEVPATALSMDDLINDAQERIELLKTELLQRTHDRVRISIEVKQGDVVQQLKEHCDFIKPYAIVMGAENNNPFQRFLFGGKTLTSLKHISWPVIVVPPMVKFSRMKKVCLACDFREVLETIPFKEIKALVTEFKAELHVVHVSHEKGDQFGEEKIQASTWLHDLLEDLKPVYHFINNTDIEKGIIQFASENDIDMLIVIPRKHNLLSTVFNHRHSERLVLQSQMPVMAIHE